ncbi:MAG: permease [Clostridiales bacterium]|nr:permease [Clostridiales bacterium]
MTGLYIFTIISVLISFLMDRKKTILAFKVALKKFVAILPSFLKMLIYISFILMISDQLIIKYLGQENSILGLVSSLILGSITIMPGFIAYPLAGILVEKGISYMVVAGFVTSLMMVGVITYPVEKEYLGVKGTLMRNGMSFIISIIVALIIGISYGEVF